MTLTDKRPKKPLSPIRPGYKETLRGIRTLGNKTQYLTAPVLSMRQAINWLDKEDKTQPRYLVYMTEGANTRGFDYHGHQKVSYKSWGKKTSTKFQLNK